MPCARCGQNRSRRTPTTTGGRPGTSYNPGNPGGSQTTKTGTNGVKDAINGLRYVPSK